jgi:hypothetical protein
MEAQFDSICPSCGGRIRAGDTIVNDIDGWQHDECPQPKAREVCDKCWLEKPCACDD